MIKEKQVVVIGSGLAGLAAAFDLGRAGNRVLVLEASNQIGGLAGSLSIGARSIERFYHFICRGDNDLLDMVQELGLKEKLHWSISRTSFFYKGRLFGFGTPFDLLAFTPVPPTQRIRFGYHVLRSRLLRDWRKLDGESARSWLVRNIGKDAYDVIWDPLLRIKFGEYHTQVSAAWIWHRIFRVASSRRHLWERDEFGYLENGSDTIIQGLYDRIKAMPNVQVRLGTGVTGIETRDERVSSARVSDDPNPIECTEVISTVALPVLLRLVPTFSEAFRKKLEQVEYLGVVCGLLKLRKRLTDSFWVNISDPGIPFNGIIEYSNLNRHLGMGDNAIVYIPYYLRTSEPRFTYNDERLLAEFVDGLTRIVPDFDRSWIEEYHVSRAQYAQAICSVGFANIVPGHETPVKGLYITDSAQFYPEDRTISAAIRLGRRAASMILTSGGS